LGFGDSFPKVELFAKRCLGGCVSRGNCAGDVTRKGLLTSEHVSTFQEVKTGRDASSFASERCESQLSRACSRALSSFYVASTVLNAAHASPEPQDHKLKSFMILINSFGPSVSYPFHQVLLSPLKHQQRRCPPTSQLRLSKQLTHLLDYH
jgi:hypothetical protein